MHLAQTSAVGVPTLRRSRPDSYRAQRVAIRLGLMDENPIGDFRSTTRTPKPSLISWMAGARPADVGPPGSFKAIVSPPREANYDFSLIALIIIYSMTSC